MQLPASLSSTREAGCRGRNSKKVLVMAVDRRCAFLYRPIFMWDVAVLTSYQMVRPLSKCIAPWNKGSLNNLVQAAYP